MEISWKICDLKKECSKYKLPTYGTKAVLVKRIKEYLKENVKEVDGNEDKDDDNALNECTINLSNNNNDKCLNESLDDDSLDDEYDENIVEQINQNGKRVSLVKLHEFDKYYETLEQAKEIVDKENTWNFQRTRRTPKLA